MNSVLPLSRFTIHHINTPANEPIIGAVTPVITTVFISYIFISDKLGYIYMSYPSNVLCFI